MPFMDEDPGIWDLEILAVAKKEALKSAFLRQ